MMMDILVNNFANYLANCPTSSADSESFTLLSLLYGRLRRGLCTRSLKSLVERWALQKSSLAPSESNLRILKLIMNYLTSINFSVENGWFYYLCCACIINQPRTLDDVLKQGEEIFQRPLSISEMLLINRLCLGIGNFLFYCVERWGWRGAKMIINQLPAILEDPHFSFNNNDLERLADTVLSLDDAICFFQFCENFKEIWSMETFLPLNDVVVRLKYPPALLIRVQDILIQILQHDLESQRWALANICSNTMRTILGSGPDDPSLYSGAFSITCALAIVDSPETQKLVKMLVEKASKMKNLLSAACFQSFSNVVKSQISLSPLQKEIWQLLAGLAITNQLLLEELLVHLESSPYPTLFLDMNIICIISSTLEEGKLKRLILFLWRVIKSLDESIISASTSLLGTTASRVISMLKSWMKMGTSKLADNFILAIRLLASIFLWQIRVMHVPIIRIIKEYGLDGSLLLHERSLPGLLMPALLYSEMLSQDDSGRFREAIMGEGYKLSWPAAITFICLAEEEFQVTSLLTCLLVTNINQLRRLFAHQSLDLSVLLVRSVTCLLDNFNLPICIKRWCRALNLLDMGDYLLPNNLLIRLLLILQQRAPPIMILAMGNQVKKSIDPHVLDLFDLVIEVALSQHYQMDYFEAVMLPNQTTIEFLLNRITAVTLARPFTTTTLPLICRCLLYSLLQSTSVSVVKNYLENLLSLSSQQLKVLVPLTSWVIAASLERKNIQRELVDETLDKILQWVLPNAPDMSFNTLSTSLSSTKKAGSSTDSDAVIVVMTLPGHELDVKVAILRAMVARGNDYWLTFSSIIVECLKIPEHELVRAGLFELTTSLHPLGRFQLAD